MPIPDPLTRGLRIPVIAAPMFLVSTPQLVVEACNSGVIGAFPTLNARSVDVLEEWLGTITRQRTTDAAAWAANVVSHRSNSRLADDLALIAEYRPPLVITALGSPAPVVEVVHEYGGSVFADVNDLTYARKAAASGVDGLVLVAAGAGGHTGEISGFAFAPAVRALFDGTIVLGGAISTGGGIRAAQHLGADLAYVGTPFIATPESMADDRFREMVVEATVDDLIVSDKLSGAKASWLVPSLLELGLDPHDLGPGTTFDMDANLADVKRWSETLSAGQGVGTVDRVRTVAELVELLVADYAAAADGATWPPPGRRPCPS